MDYIEAIFVPIQIHRVCFSEEEAKKTSSLVKEMADFLATKFPVYERTALSIKRDKDWEYDQDEWHVSQRLTIGPTSVKPGYK